MGTKQGIPDIHIIRPTRGYVCMVIELKRQSGGRVSPEQYDWLRKYAEAGWCARVFKGHIEAINAVKEIYG